MKNYLIFQQFFYFVFYKSRTLKNVHEEKENYKKEHPKLFTQNLQDYYGMIHILFVMKVPKIIIRIFDDFRNLILEFYIFIDPENQDIISFTDKGNAFVVKDQARLSNQILPTQFKHHNFSSFIRQLNMYGFKKIRNVNNQNEFSHYYFRYNQENLLSNIPRRNGCQKKIIDKEKEKKQKQLKKLQYDLSEKYSALRQDLQSISLELNQTYQQIERFQTTQQTLVESSRSQLLELSLIKTKRNAFSDLLCQLLMKMASQQMVDPQHHIQYQTNTTTKSNGTGSVDNNDIKDQSSKDDTNQSNGSNQQIEEEKLKVE